MIMFQEKKWWRKYIEIVAVRILGFAIGAGIAALCIWLQHICHQ